MTLDLRRAALLLYVVALAASTAVRWHRAGSPPQLPAGAQSIELRAVDRDLTRRREAVAVSYYRSAPEEAAGAAGGSAIPVVLLHGSPGAASNFDELAPLLATQRPVLVPDLPGFGHSTRHVPDYSIAAHADYLLQFLDALEIESAHLVGFSMGGGVALHVADRAPQRVSSLTLVSAIGVQELELLGDYTLNRLVHAVQLWGLRALTWLVPHFGALDRGMLSVEYARNFYDTDQRPLRRILRRWPGPTLIVHGENDFLVPAQAALEHHRLVPQSELVLRDDSHFFLFTDPDAVAAHLRGFFDRVERGEAPLRRDASPSRLAEAARGFDRGAIPPWSGPALLVMLVLIALSTLISEDLTCVGSGVLVAQGRLSLIAAIAACYAGILLGDLLLFWIGRTFGRAAVRRPPLRWWISDEALEESSRWLRRRGAVMVLLSRFLPGARLPTNLAAGVLRTRGPRFLLYFAIAGALWTPPVVWISAHLGRSLLPQLEGLRARLLIAALLLALLIWSVRKLVLPLLTHAGRRRAIGRWQRIRHWEFWPWWLVYPPVILRMLYEGLRRRDLLLFTAVNPAIPAGGFVGESKSAILEGLRGGESFLPRWRRIDGGVSPEQGMRAVERFTVEHDLDFPLVLKPDRGERGRDVRVVHSLEEAHAYFEGPPRPRPATLVQEYVGGAEYGVFWSRGPDDAEGTILSIHEKRRPVVEGDGRRTLERLILDDARAVALLHKYRNEHPDAHRRIPDAGEKVVLVDIGAHNRGTIFVDVCEHATPELHAAIGEIADRLPGFDFGRLDLKVPDVESLRSGREITLIEINGVTSEAAHMYDRRHGILDAWRILGAQWAECYRIGEQRRRGGQPVLSWIAFAKLVLTRRVGEPRPAPESR
ncbi:MAG: alpha/beta fold hydrolase [Acidobacteria bacterium]|nr:MAG: alpha/beta fold hydrolase [Acidobacteriota bacterium]REK05886.1 MAG: alpha/beta fold hydrolase [Acidobacteriota bacterium]